MNEALRLDETVEGRPQDYDVPVCRYGFYVIPF